MLDFLGEADAADRIRAACAHPGTGSTSQIGDSIAARVRQASPVVLSRQTRPLLTGAAMPIQTTPKIWMNGELVDWDKAQVHVLTHTLHYGTGVFEGIRAYSTASGPAVFRLTDHIKRLFNSAHIMGMEHPVHGRRADRRDQGHRRVDRTRRVLRPPAGVLRLRRDGAQHAALQGRRRHRLLAVGAVPRHDDDGCG